MANIKNSDFDKKPAPIGAGVSVVADIRAVVAPTVAPTAGDTQELCVLPAGHVPVGYLISVPDLDSGTTVTFSLGFLNALKTDLSTDAAEGGAVLASTKTTAQAGGFLVPEAAALAKVQPANVDRYLAVKYSGTFAGWQAGTWNAQLLHRPA